VENVAENTTENSRELPQKIKCGIHIVEYYLTLKKKFPPYVAR
jgi:hypothetical protein